MNTWDRHPVLNLRLLNQFIPHRHFKMESLETPCTLINQEDYFTSIDLADDFLHVLVHHSSRRYLQLIWDGQLFQFGVLSFGLSLSPLIFTKILRPVLRWARRERHTPVGVFRRFVDRSQGLSNVPTTQKYGSQQTGWAGLLYQRSQIHTYYVTQHAELRL